MCYHSISHGEQTFEWHFNVKNKHINVFLKLLVYDRICRTLIHPSCNFFEFNPPSLCKFFLSCLLITKCSCTLKSHVLVAPSIRIPIGAEAKERTNQKAVFYEGTNQKTVFHERKNQLLPA